MGRGVVRLGLRFRLKVMLEDAEQLQSIDGGAGSSGR